MHKQQGTVYLWCLIGIVLLSLGLGRSLEVYSTQKKREKEEEQRYILSLYEKAINDYYHNTPGEVKQWPDKLEDLLKDPRYVTPKRYIRSLYPDPATGAPPLGIMPKIDREPERLRKL